MFQSIFSLIVHPIMCGIFGLIVSEEVEIPNEAAEAASQVLLPRGPDSLGVHFEPGAMIGMRRLAIIDPEGPCPPIFNESKRLLAVGNGEVYNHTAIRKQLERSGHRFRTDNDLETLVHLEEEALPDWELGLRGMFAFAIWDRAERALHLGRDRFGIKPLFWCGDENGVAFASTLPALKEMLMAIGACEKADRLPKSLRSLATPSGWKLNNEALLWYLDTLCVPAPMTIYENVHALPPASRILWQLGQAPALEPYWNPTYEPKRKLSLDDAIPLFEESFRESVRHHLVSDVPVGAFLSGGLDSGYLVAEAASQMGARLSTYTVGFREANYSELPLAQEMAGCFGTDHHEMLLDPFTQGDLPSIVSAMNQPFGDSSAWPTWAISRAVGKNLKVVLAGDGGDELWGGYPYYAIHNMGRWLPRNYHASGMDHPYDTSFSSRARRVLGDLKRNPNDLYRRWRHLDPNGSFWEKILREDFKSPGVEFPRSKSSGSPHDGLLERDVRFYLPSDLLEKVDTMSMAHSLEVRVPWLDPVLFEVVAHFPSTLKINGGITKWLLRKSAEKRAGWLPQSVLRAKKQGFAIPIHRWISNELAGLFHEGPLDRNSRVAPLMDLVSLRRYYEAHRAGHIRLGHALWAVLVLDIWLRQNGLEPS
ncbi:MAG: asparagine synthase (glutamine-hydrolyzing) [Candidatus Omnitrophica bacterium]|nr:asparagine synthase (glutamine-hydrolyzing) [Candidatus Omnitrophota bacterium]